MVITKHGPSFWKIQYGDTVLSFNPPAEDSAYESARFGADIVLSAIRHPDFTGGDLLTAGDKDPFSIVGPGEYEIGGIFARGLQSSSHYEDEEWINTIYMVELQGIQICHLGLLDEPELPQESAEGIEEIDILFVPIGGEDEGVLGASEAYKLAVNLGPHVIIPSHFRSADSTQVTNFLKEAGVAENVDPQEKLTLSSRDVSGTEGEIAVIQES